MSHDLTTPEDISVNSWNKKNVFSSPFYCCGTLLFKKKIFWDASSRTIEPAVKY